MDIACPIPIIPPRPDPERSNPSPAGAATPRPRDPSIDNATAWAEDAEALADWTLAQVAVRRDVYGRYGADGRPSTGNLLTREKLVIHYRGEQLIGLHTIGVDNRVKCLTIDIDAHGEEITQEIRSRNWNYAESRARELLDLGLEVLVLDSNGRGGYHVRAWFRRPVDSGVAYRLGRRLVADSASHGFERPPEVFPKAPGVGNDRPYGDWVRLPGRHPKRDHWTRLFDPRAGSWSEGPFAITKLLGVRGGDPAEVERLDREAGGAGRAGPGPGPAEGRGSPAGPTAHRRWTALEVRRLLEHMPPAMKEEYGDGRDRPGWLQVGMALHAWDATQGLELWDAWSRGSPKYEAGRCAEKWGSFDAGRDGAVTLGTLVHLARRNGYQGPVPDGPGAGQGAREGGARPRQSPWTPRLVSSHDLEDLELRRDWLVERAVIAGRPGVLGGPSKSLKTGIAVDLAVSVAGGVPFLGHFGVPAPTRVLVLSGESGLATLRETGRRVAAARGLSLKELGDRLVWSEDLPRLGGAGEGVQELAELVRAGAYGLVLVDPWYLCLQGGEREVMHSNLFHMGGALKAAWEPLRGTGATLLIVHHFHGRKGQPHDPPTLEDLAFAGIREFTRQWILVGRRSRFEPALGRHELHLALGGSDGHASQWQLDVEEGPLDADFSGRRWDVRLLEAREAIEVARRERDERRDDRRREKDRDQERETSEDAEAAQIALEGAAEDLSKSRWKDRLGWGDSRFGRALEHLRSRGLVEQVEGQVGCNNGRRSIQVWRAVPGRAINPAQAMGGDRGPEGS